jgi:hypothetical protein
MNGDRLRAVRIGAGAPAEHQSVENVSAAVAGWVDDVGRFLGVLQKALEESRPREDASPEVRALAGQLPALIRECRAQVPTPEMIRTWVKSVSIEEAEEPQAVGARL